MKLRITLKQFDELSRKGKKKYTRWCIEKGYEREHCKSCGVIPDMLNIGQIIEYLEYEGKLGQIIHLLNWTGDTCTWRVTSNNNIPVQVLGNIDFKELCDALWELTKKKLEKGMK